MVGLGHSFGLLLMVYIPLFWQRSKFIFMGNWAGSPIELWRAMDGASQRPLKWVWSDGTFRRKAKKSGSSLFWLLFFDETKKSDSPWGESPELKFNY
jgi:hypothetical protein